MAEKTKSNPALTRQRNAAIKALAEKNWAVAIRNYSKALAHDGVSLELQIELLTGRADCYAQTGERNSQLADLSDLSNLYEAAQTKSLVELDERSANLAIVNEINQALSDQTDFHAVIDLVGDRISDFFKLESVGIVIYERDKKILITEYYKDHGKRIEIEPTPLGEGLTSEIIRSKKKRVFGTREEARKNGAINLDRVKAESWVGVPIFAGSEVIGVLSLLAAEKHAFQAEQVASVSAIAANLGWALENARLFDETQRRNAELAIINSVQSALAEQSDIFQIYEIVGEKIREIFDVGAIQINLYDLSLGINNYVYVFEDGKRLNNLSKPIEKIDKFYMGKGTQLFNSGMSDIFKKFEMTPPNEGRWPQSAIVTQVKLRDKTVLTVGISDLDNEHAFTQADANLLENITNSMAGAIENARLFDETQQRNAELAIINSVQSALAEELDILQIYEIVGEKIRELFNVGALTINVYNIVADTNDYVYVYEDGERLDNLTVPINAMHRHYLDKGTILLNSGMRDVAKKFGVGSPAGRLSMSTIWVHVEQRDKKILAVHLSDLDKHDAFTEADARLLETITNSMAGALENARLFDESQQRLAELEIVNTAQDALASKLEIKSIYREVGEKVREIFHAQTIVISSFDFSQSMVNYEYAFEKGEEIEMSSRPFETVHTEFIERGKTLLMNEGVAEYNKKHKFIIQHGEEPLSALSVLLKVGGEIKGSISLQDMDKEHAFSQSDVQLLETLAKSTSIALENARLFDESLQRQAELEVVNTAQDALASKLDISAIYREVGEKVREIFRAQTISIHSYDFEKGLVTEEYGYEKGMETMVPERPMTPAHRDLASRGTTLINEGMPDYIKKHDHKIVAGEMPKSLLSVRLKVDNDIKGAISLQDVDKEHAFTQSDVQLLETLAKSTSIALENARLFNESLQRQAELEIVNTAQDALAAKLDKQSIFEEVGEKIREIFKAQTVVLYTYDLEKNLTIYEYTFEDGERLPSNIQPINDAHREFIESGQTLLMNEGMEEYLASTNTKITTGKPPKAILSVLLKVAGEVRGAISLQDVEREHVFTQSDVQLLETLAKSTSIALENARLFEEIQSSNQEISAALERQNATGNILEVIARSPGDLSSILEVIASTAARLLDTQNVVIGTVQGEDLNVAAKHGSLPFLKTGEVIPLEEKTVAGQAIREKKTLQALHNQKGKKSKYPKGNETAKKYGYELTLSTPLIREGKAIGVISVLRTKAKFFSEPQVDLLKSFANQAVIAIDNERLFNESNRLLSKTEKLLKEAEASNLEISESLQLQTANSDILNEIANSPTEIQPVLDAVAENAAELCAADDSQIYTIDGKELRQVAHFGTIRSLNTNETLPLRKGLVTGRAVLECRTLHIEDYNKLSKKKYPLSVELQKRLGHRTTLVAPLLLEGKAIGAVVVRRKVQRAFSDKQIAILENFANQAVIAIEKARLFTESNRLLEETTKRNAELAVINSLQDALAKELDIKGIYNAVGDQIKDIFDAQAVMIGSFDHKSKLVSLPYMFEKGEKFDLPPQAFSAMNRKMIRDKKTIVINENADAESKKLGMEVPAGEASKSGVWIPIIVGKDVTGFVSLQNIDRENAFPESDVQLLTTVTNSLAVALENARLFDEIVQRNAELDIINSVGEAMAQQLDVATVTKIVGDKVKDIVSAEAVFIGLFEEGEESVTFPYLFDEGKYFEVGKQPRGGLSNLVKESRKPQVFNTVEEQEKAGGILLDIEEGNDQQTQSWMGVPIITADKVIGLVSVQSYQIAAFSESDVQLLSTLATNMGVAIRNAQLYQEVERRVSEMAILAEVGEEISQELELNALLEQIASQAMDLLSGRNAIIRLRQPDDTLPAVVAVGAFQDLFKGNVIKVGEGITGKIIQSGQAELVNNPLDDPRLMHVPGTEEEDEAILFAPLNAGDRALGVLVVWREKSKHGEFNDIDLNFGVGLARQAAIAIQNAQLFEEATQRAEEMAALAAVGEEISQELEVQTLLEQIASRAINLLDATDAVIRLVLPDGTMPAIVDVGERARKMTEETVSQRVGEGINGLIALSGVAEIVNSVKSDKRAVPVAGLSLDELGYAMFVPFISKGKTIAVMSIFRSGPDKKPFDQDDLTFVISLARQAAIAMGNANLFEEVQSQKEYFEALLVNNPAAVLTIDIEEFTVTSWNPAAEAMFGYSAEEAIGKKVDSLVANDPDLHQEAEGYSAKALALGHVKIKAKRTRKDGTLIDVEVQGLPVTVEGQQKGFIVIYHDISELESARRAAEEANQAKSAFLANMSHELRTPLNAIIGFTRIVKRKGADILPAKQSDNLDKVLVSADHLLGLINTILDIAKIEAGRMDVRMDNFNIKALVDLCLTTTQPLINAPSVTLLSEIPPNTTELYSDQEKIKQILLNLLSNAAKFTKKGEIKLSVKESNEQIYMTVTDTGIGISQDGVKNIFEEFQQVDDSSTREYGGTGLGLSISRSLAQLLGGDISVFSQEGIGSEFTLSLPLHFKPSTIAEPSIKVQQLEEKTAELTTDKPIVLAIDDNPDVVAILRENLEDQGYQVVGASSGEQGVQKALALQPDAITLDIMMPSKDGWQVLYELKHDVKTKHIPVIILSIVDKKALGFRLGASDYLVKPLNEKAVINSLSNLVASKGVSEKKRILVIDDDHTVIDMVRQLLEDEQHLIEDAADGEIALAKLRDFSPDLILLDLLMPNMDGFEFLEKFRQTKKNKEIPVIILTAKSLSTREIKVLENQVSEVIEKQGLEGKKLISEISKSTQRKPMKAAK